MNIFKYEYKVHKLVKLAFHLIFFIAGFVLGLSISSANAYSFGTLNGVPLDEEYIYTTFSSKFSTFNFSDYPNIFCSKHLINSKSTLECYAMDNTSADSFYYAGASGSWWMWRFGNNSLSSPTPMLKFATTISTAATSFGTTSSIFNYLGSNSTSGTYPSASNFNITSGNVNVLNFSSYQTLTYNPNLFKNDPNFKEVCVNPTDTFSITSKQIQGYNENNNSPYYHSFDFMWFPDGVKGISTYQYDTREESHISLFEESENSFSGWWYWLNTREEIDTYFGRDNPGLQLQIRGYTNKYNYYNYTMYPFEMAFTPDYYYYPVFWFRDLKINTSISNPLQNIGSSDGWHALGGGRHDNESEEETSKKICFYIKNEYDVNILNKNSNGDIYGDITVLGDMNFHDQSYYNELNVDKSGLLNKVNTYIDYMRDTINFINTNIFNLYTSMPLLVRLFILSLLTIFVIRLILGMVM